jgi:hypothetical protein
VFSVDFVGGFHDCLRLTSVGLFCCSHQENPHTHKHPSNKLLVEKSLRVV